MVRQLICEDETDSLRSKRQQKKRAASVETATSGRVLRLAQPPAPFHFPARMKPESSQVPMLFWIFSIRAVSKFIRAERKSCIIEDLYVENE
jgi:hypothetical protein